MKKHTLQDCFTLRARIGWQGLRSDEFKTDGAYLVTGTDFQYGKIDWDTCYHVSVERYEQDKGIQLKENDLLVTKDGTVGKTAFVVNCPDQATLNSHIFLVRSIDGSVLPEYLYYILNSQTFVDFMNNKLTGTTIKGLTQGNFYTFSFNAPDTENQRKIIEVLSSVDEVIEGTRQLIIKYQSIKKGLLQELLKCDRKVPISALGRVVSGSTPSTTEEKYWNGKNVWITPADLSRISTPYITDSERHLTDAGVKKATGALIPADSVIISNRAPVGYCAVVTVPFTYNQGCKAIVCDDAVDPLYLYYYLSTQKHNLECVSSGTTFLELPKRELERFMIAIPEDVQKQRDISEKIYVTDEKINLEMEYKKKMENIKTGLIHDLLLGSVDVSPLI